MLFTVRATLTDTADIAQTEMCDCDLDYERDGLTVVSIDKRFAVRFVKALHSLGIEFHPGKPRGAYRDPTPAMVHQRLEPTLRIRRYT